MYMTILTYFLNDTLNWQVLWGKEKHLLNSLYEKMKNKLNVNSKECFFEFQTNKGQIYNSNFLNSVKL